MYKQMLIQAKLKTGQMSKKTDWLKSSKEAKVRIEL